jgi:enoyl-CoA hydratase/carnithine racemase
LNRAIDWLKSEGIERVAVTGDFHLSTQMIGADTSDFFPALEVADAGFQIAKSWSQTARRLYHEFELSIGFINGKRCLGGFLELLLHCHYLVSVEDADLGMPEVTLPVVPGMEGCHWPFRKTGSESWPKMLALLLEGKFIKAKDTLGWLVDYAGSQEEAIQTVWKILNDGDHNIPRRKLNEQAIPNIPREISGLSEADDSGLEAARAAIFKNVQEACNASLSEALDIQARHSAEFMVSSHCKKGQVGAEFTRTMKV